MFIPQNPEKLIEELREMSVVVEGKRDKDALNSLGIEDVVDISGKSMESLTQKLTKTKNYVVLTDFDDEGELKNKTIRIFFEKNGFKFNSRLRRSIKSVFGVSKIEELIKFSKLKEDVYHGKISTINYKVFNRSRFYRKWCSRKTRRNWSNIWSN